MELSMGDTTSSSEVQENKNKGDKRSKKMDLFIRLFNFSPNIISLFMFIVI